MLVLPPDPLILKTLYFLGLTALAVLLFIAYGLERSHWVAKLLVAAISLCAVGSGRDVLIHLRGKAPPNKVLIAPPDLTRRDTMSVKVRRTWPSLYLRPQWGVKVSLGRSPWDRTVRYCTIGRHRAHAEKIAAELRHVLDISSTEAVA
jgi:hypothetical protein